MLNYSNPSANSYRHFQTGATAEFERRPFLANVRIDHGPMDLLSQFFIAADAAYAALELDLMFANFEDLAGVNVANRTSWKPLNPTFVPAHGLVTADRAFALFGVDKAGNVLSAIGGVLFDWSDTSLSEEAASLRFLFNQPASMAPAGATCRISAPSTALIRGRAAYSGAHWVHPNLRKRNLAAVNSRLARAVAFARWNFDVAFGISSLELIRRGYSDRTGWRNIEAGVQFEGLDSCPPEAGLVWMPAHQALEDLCVFLLGHGGAAFMQFGSPEYVHAAVDFERHDQSRIPYRNPPA